MEKSKHCRKCNVRLHVNRNWSEANCRARQNICKPCQTVAQRAYRAKNKEKLLQKARVTNRRWRKANPEKMAAAVENWKKRNPDRVREYRRKSQAARRARKRAERISQKEFSNDRIDD